MSGAPERQVFDALIVGGSVAGAATALFLARRGRRVAMLDRAHFPREKPCGEGLMPHGVDVVRELGLLERLLAQGARPLRGVRYRLANGESAFAAFVERTGSEGALGVRRCVLDSVLHTGAASESDVTVLDGTRVLDVGRDAAGRLCVRTTAGVLRGRVLVGADGLHSTVRARLGWNAQRRILHRYGVTGHFRLPAARSIESTIEVLLADGLEAYLTPLAHGELLIALLGSRKLMRRFAGDLAGGFARVTAAQPFLADTLAGAERIGSVLAAGPFAVRARRVAGRGVLLVGDAAGFLDPITGEGMASALEQSRIAARVIDDALREGGVPCLEVYAQARQRMMRTTNALTCVALALTRSSSLRGAAMRGMQHRSGLFERLLAINTRDAGFGSLTPRDWISLATGW